MTFSLQLLLAAASLPTLCFAVNAVAPLPIYAQTPTQTVFSDVQPNYWAQPFIQRLAQRNIVAGYPDGTFRPEQAVQRDELAAIIRKAFNQPPVRQIESGSVYEDVSEGYWAERPIESASQQGFMSGDSSGNFRPNQPVTKVQAITALNQGLDLTSDTPVAASTQPTTQRRARRRPVFVPIAITSLMQHLLIPRAEAVPSPATTPRTTPQTTQPDRSASAIVSDYYTDASSIPQNAIPDVAKATKQNIVVNYPNPKVLNPNQPASRAEIAALIHQTLVSQGRIEPLAKDSSATQYIVRTSGNNQNTQ
ncbi:S-layer homology domain-containing protein [Komarekiella sp. 'clone 1']|uniref:S-layer homology domain-containing protein n=1 Tax=Komarekiella delphini-convector SJRDD-AB1 TaxID=2593771 RepID=A0AA40VPL5_9NOST|nr:S-layer homology domain-containing protein [Komarekiella delphini-convector]MBD6614865.1 S-layer homology domain-containing protein [Komarekiella delphini-convector SJRDD-AB1]